MKENNNFENNVTRELDKETTFDRSIKIIITTCCILFVMLFAFAIFDSFHVSADPGCPYDRVSSTEVIEMQKSYNKFLKRWETYEVIIYCYNFDGINGVYVSCPELGEHLDFYGFSTYKVLNKNAGQNSKDNPSFNLVIQKNKDDDSGIYIHPDRYTKAFMFVQHIKYPEDKEE